jgi:hypothetical protein
MAKRPCTHGVPVDKKITDGILLDWETGGYTQTALAEKHRVSIGLVNRVCKDAPKKHENILKSGIAYKTMLYEQEPKIVKAIEKVVDDKSRDIEFFNNAQRKLANVGLALIAKSIDANGVPSDDFSIGELVGVSNVVQASRTGILGKPGDTTNIQINNTVRIEDLLGDL